MNSLIYKRVNVQTVKRLFLNHMAKLRKVNSRNRTSTTRGFFEDLPFGKLTLHKVQRNPLWVVLMSGLASILR